MEPGEIMIWYLMLIYLGGDPVSVQHTEIVETHYSEQECVKRLKTIFREADQEGKPVPPEVNMGCVPYKGRGA